MGCRTGLLRLLALLGLLALLPGCFTIGTIFQLSTEHTRVELSVDRAWLTPDDWIEIDIDVYSGNGEERTLHASIARSALDTPFAAGDQVMRQHLPASAVRLGPKAGQPPAEAVQAGIPVVRLPKSAPDVEDLAALEPPAGSELCIFELTRHIEGPKGDPIDFGIAVAGGLPGSEMPRIARIEITLEDSAGKNSQSDLVRLLLAVGLDLLVIALISRLQFGFLVGP